MKELGAGRGDVTKTKAAKRVRQNDKTVETRFECYSGGAWGPACFPLPPARLSPQEQAASAAGQLPPRRICSVP